MTYKWLIAIFIFTGNVHAEVNYRELCADFMENETTYARPMLPDTRSALEIILALNNVTRAFSLAHPEFEVSSSISRGEGEYNSIIAIKPENAIEIVDNLFKNVRLATQADQGMHFTQDYSDFAQFKGWIVNQTLWKSHGLFDEKWSKNLRFAAALAPSREFQLLKGFAGANTSIYKREIEVVRFHPSVMVFVPASVLQLSGRNLRQEFPEADKNIESQFHKRGLENMANEERQSFQFYNAPKFKDVFTQKALLKLLQQLKREVDETVGALTNWSVGARSRGGVTEGDLTELIVRIDHPKVEIAWRASLEFANRYALALQRRVPLETPAPDSIPTPTYIPIVLPGIQK